MPEPTQEQVAAALTAIIDRRRPTAGRLTVEAKLAPRQIVARWVELVPPVDMVDELQPGETRVVVYQIRLDGQVYANPTFELVNPSELPIHRNVFEGLIVRHLERLIEREITQPGAS